MPYPPSYGGVIDVYYKVKALHNMGVRVILHSFDYGRGEKKELEAITEKTYYYKRNTSIFCQISILPYIVLSRKSDRLLNNLLLDDYPIFFEGLHTCYYLGSSLLRGRVKIVRMHNIEHDYYLGLACRESNPIKKMFFHIESWKLKRFSNTLRYASQIAAISEADFSYLQRKFGNVFLLPPFHGSGDVSISTQSGDFVLYHGSLDVQENVEAALYLIKTFYEESAIKLVVAGRNMSSKIVKAKGDASHIRLIDTPSDDELNALIANAQVNILPTFQPTGIKLKLINALYKGKHILCNNGMVAGTHLASLCHVADNSQEIITICKQLMITPFSQVDIDERKKVLLASFDNRANTRSLADRIFVDC